MSITLYTAPMSSASPVECALQELGVAHERVVFDLSKDAHKQPEFLKLNPNGKVPTLVVDGTPIFEAVAIMQWLGDRYGVARKLWPAPDAPARLQALAWSSWAYVTLGSTIQRLNFAQSPRVPAALHSAAQAEVVRRDLTHLLDILDEQLSDKPYLLGADYSLTDLIVACCVRYGTLCGIAIDGHAHVTAWAKRCFERPALKAYLS